MAELLIKAKDAVHSDAKKDKSGCYKAGMVVQILPDGHIYGKEEGLPTFYRIKIPSVDVDDEVLKALMEPQQKQDGFHEDGKTPKYEIARRRKSWLRVNKLSKKDLATLKKTGELTIDINNSKGGKFDTTWGAVKKCFWDDDKQSKLDKDPKAKKV